MLSYSVIPLLLDREGIFSLSIVLWNLMDKEQYRTINLDNTFCASKLITQLIDRAFIGSTNYVYVEMPQVVRMLHPCHVKLPVMRMLCVFYQSLSEDSYNCYSKNFYLKFR